jgi:hypothetical protein
MILIDFFYDKYINKEEFKEYKEYHKYSNKKTIGERRQIKSENTKEITK